MKEVNLPSDDEKNSRITVHEQNFDGEANDNKQIVMSINLLNMKA